MGHRSGQRRSIPFRPMRDIHGAGDRASGPGSARYSPHRTWDHRASFRIAVNAIKRVGVEPGRVGRVVTLHRYHLLGWTCGKDREHDGAPTLGATGSRRRKDHDVSGGRVSGGDAGGPVRGPRSRSRGRGPAATSRPSAPRRRRAGRASNSHLLLECRVWTAERAWLTKDMGHLRALGAKPNRGYSSAHGRSVPR